MGCITFPSPRFLLFLLGVIVLFQLALFIIKRFFTEPYNQPIFQALAAGSIHPGNSGAHPAECKEGMDKYEPQ
jgi:hypothetical protein